MTARQAVVEDPSFLEELQAWQIESTCFGAMCRKNMILFFSEIPVVTKMLHFLAARIRKIVPLQCMTTSSDISKTKSANLLPDYLYFSVLMLVFGLYVCLKEPMPHC